MSKICANCEASLGPFYSVQIYYNDTVWVCKNTKNAQNRITECVKRRETADNKKYQEQMHVYA